MTKRAAFKAIVGACAVVAGSLAVPAAAQAAYSCQYNEICIYENPHYTGSVFVVHSGYIADFNAKNSSGYHIYKYTNGDLLVNSASSVCNRSAYRFTLYEDANKGGRRVTISPGVPNPDLSHTILDPRSVSEVGFHNFDNVASSSQIASFPDKTNPAPGVCLTY
jgi:hypothetical protein